MTGVLPTERTAGGFGVKTSLGFSKHICIAFNALWGCYDRCFTNGKDRGWFWGQNMVSERPLISYSSPQPTKCTF